MPRTLIIPDIPDQPHSLTVARHGEALLIHTNNREMYGAWGTFGFSPAMAQQLIDGLEAVLSGNYDKAVTEQTIRLGQETEARRAQIAQEHGATAATTDYSSLFEDQPCPTA